MLSSSTLVAAEDTPHCNNNNNVTNSLLKKVSSSSSSSSSSSTSSPFSPSPLPPPPPHHLQSRSSAKTMEEVWKDINLGSLHDNYPARDQDLTETPRHHHHHSNIHPSHHHHNPNFILQDFFAGPFNKDPPNGISSNGDTTFYGSPMPPPPPATVLSLNSGPGFDFLDNSDPLPPNNSYSRSCRNISNLTTFHSPFEALASSSGLASFEKKRLQESDTSSGDKRHKRMIKNRESAARSRARKQAYTNELELEVAHLMEENARLKRQQEQLCLFAAAQSPKKRPLQRTSTAPF